MIKSVFAFIVVNAFAFFAFAFITWEVNPALWTEEMRMLSVLLGFVVGTLGAIMAGDVV
jgi:hypothetical protein